MATVVATGAALLAYGIPQTSFRQPLLFLVLLLGSMTTAVMKIHLPLSSGQATLSMSYFTDFLSLVLLGPHEAMLVAGVQRRDPVDDDAEKRRFSARQTFFSSATPNHHGPGRRFRRLATWAASTWTPASPPSQAGRRRRGDLLPL